MLFLLTLGFPLVLLVGMLLMERVERPLRADALAVTVATYLEDARPHEVETYVSSGLAPALDRYWRRRGRRSVTARHADSTA